MSNDAPGAAEAAEPSLPISAVERETGLSKDVLRKWEARYGFPTPARDAGGERLYPLEQVARLRLLKRLLDLGMRPARLVSQPLELLSELLERQTGERVVSSPMPAFAPTPSPAARPDRPDEAFIACLRRHDTPSLRLLLKQALYRDGLAEFVQDTMAAWIRLVGAAWSRGELDIHEEHLFSDVVQGVLRGVVDELNLPAGTPRIVLTTLPGEPHALGLLLVAALATLEGAYCLSLGPQTPVQEVCAAARAREANVVALSFSSTFPARQIPAEVQRLRASLPDTVEIWVGGEGARRLTSAPGLRVMQALGDVPRAIEDWRALAS